jgi:ubiquinone/menaquinone biosynthesis C-methylase UbiE
MTGGAAITVDGRAYAPDELRAAFGRLPPLSNRKAATLALIEGERVVDIGCHVGYFVAQALERFPDKDVHGIDYHAGNIEAARLLFPGHAQRFHVMSVYDLGFEGASVDCVTFQATIEHLEQAALAIKEINRVLRPGGVLIVTTDSPYYWRFVASFLRSELANRVRRGRGRLATAVFNAEVAHARHVYCWTPTTLLTLMVVNGFEYVEHRYTTEPRGRLERALTGLVPFLGSTQVLKVRKVTDAPRAFV